MLSEDNRKRIIDAIALLEAVLRESDTKIQSAAVLRALEGAGKGPGGAAAGAPGAAGGGGGDFGREDTGRWHRKL